MKTIQVKLDQTNQQRVQDLMKIYRCKTMSSLVKRMIAMEHTRWFEKTDKYIPLERGDSGYNY